MKRHIVWAILVMASFALLAPSSERASGQANSQDKHEHEFRVNSSTFANDGALPLSMVFGSCPFANGGGNESPELSWTDAPHQAKSFAAVMFDKTAAFTHWAMYNISRDTTELPANAGTANSAFGDQVFNDFFDPQYDGPCPPPNFSPVVHEYVITVYALDTKLDLTSFPPIFPATSETLYQAMFGHILGKASIHGFFSTAP